MSTLPQVCPLCGENAASSNLLRTRIYHCNSCDLRFLEDADNGSYYEDYFSRFRQDQNATAQQLREQQYRIDSAHLIHYSHGGAVLDVGCSTGGFLECLAAMGEHVLLHGIDPDRSAIAVARERNLPIRALFDTGDLLSFPPVGPYDVVVFRGTLQYLGSRLRESMEKARALLRPGGHVVVYSLPCADSFLFRLLMDDWHLFHPVEHSLLFSAEALRRMANQFGFRTAELSFPYLETAYARPARDYAAVLQMCRDGKAQAVPFWGNIMHAVLQKPLLMDQSE